MKSAGVQRSPPLFVLPKACFLLSLFIIAIGAGSPSRADYESAFAAYQAGEYDEALKATDEAVRERFAEARWWRLRLDCLATLGRYDDGVKALGLARRHHYVDAGLLVAGYEVLRQSGDPKGAQEMLAELLRYAQGSPFRFNMPDDHVWVGRAAALLGGDAREILEGFYDPALKNDPNSRTAYLAIGALALAKDDLGVAAENYRAALKVFPDDPDLLFGLAQALEEDEEEESAALLKLTLEHNPRHLGALQYIAEEALGQEDYTGASAALDKIAAVNPHHARHWALRAVLAHLQADSFGEWFCRERALETWDDNPEVDHLIGEKLSSAYRFAEGAKYQRRALKIDPQYLPARKQLAQDLLRLGDEAEGWRLVNEVQTSDPYDVVAFNLASLKDRLQNYTLLETPHFRLHMERREAAVYGPRVLALLERARKTLGKKYGWLPPQPVTVEILTRQQDFAIRTFGLPGGDGILGVCFGMVITANSPAALAGRTNNWEATLWHEYCHVVTLEQTHHRIPRWLSEGISVYEERQADPTWGDRLDHDLRRMILAGELTPVSMLNDAFRKSRSAAHFNLAYYEASLVVQYLVEKHGHETLRRILSDVAAGIPINEALALRVGELAGLDKAFDAYARATADAYGPKVDWTDPKELPALPREPASSVAAWLKDRPNHYLGRLRYAQALASEKQWTQAREVLTALVADVPQWAGDESPYTLLARAQHELKDLAGQRKTLEQSAERSADALETYRNLIELAIAENDGALVEANVERYLAVQPLEELPYRSLAEFRAAAKSTTTAERKSAVAAARSLLALEPSDRSGAHFLLAQLLHVDDDDEAKRQALLALEETPRFRDAQKLLLAIVDKPKTAKPNETKPRPPTMVLP
ncbi:MAG: hypothetical protein C0483_23980 [Pirellula sp.]|nr:hypothetical protein [Pirellula sp.]